MKFVIPIVLALATTCQGQCFSRGRRVQCVQRVQQVVQQVPVQTLFLVAPPSYYGAPQYTAPRGTSSADIQELTKLVSQIATGLKALEERVDSLSTTGNGQTASIIEQQCGKCHGGGEEKGGFALSSLSDPATKIVAMRLVDSGKMPCGPDGENIQLDPATRAELVRAIRDY